VTEPPSGIEQGIVWAPDSVWTFYRQFLGHLSLSFFILNPLCWL